MYPRILTAHAAGRNVPSLMGWMVKTYLLGRPPLINNGTVYACNKLIQKEPVWAQ